jgi:hypothetical protein
MSATSIVVQGTVTSDGNLKIDQKLVLPAGPVQVTIQTSASLTTTQKDWWQRMQEARAVLEARGTGFRSEQEIEAEREAFRAE